MRLHDAALDAYSVVGACLRQQGTVGALERALPRLIAAPRLVAHTGRHVVADAHEWAVRECPEESLTYRCQLHGILGAHGDAQRGGRLSHDIYASPWAPRIP